MKRTALAFCFILVSFISEAQINLKDSTVFVPLLHFSYAGQLPGGDMAKQFGFNSNVAINFSLKTRKNWLYGIDFTYIFGNQLKGGSPLDSITTHVEHSLIDQNGEFPSVRLYERGFSSTAWAGKLIPVLSPNPNSGIVINIGVGWLQYHYRIEDIGNKSPQLAGALKKGYDRLTSGPELSEYIGYTYLSNKRMVNFFFGFEFLQAYTKDRRAFDYEMMRPDNAQRIDLLSGIRVGWILPLYKRMPKEFYYN